MNKKTKIEEHNDLAIKAQYLESVIERAYKAADERAMAKIVDEAYERLKELENLKSEVLQTVG